METRQISKKRPVRQVDRSRGVVGLFAVKGK